MARERALDSTAEKEGASPVDTNGHRRRDAAEEERETKGNRFGS